MKRDRWRPVGASFFAVPETIGQARAGRRSRNRCALALAVVVLACDGRITDSEPVEPGLDAQLRQEIANWGVVPIGAVSAQPPALVALGRALFFDKVLSGNRDVACATCHDPASALGDGRSLPVGTGGSGAGAARAPGDGRAFVPRHAPSLLNAGLGAFYLLWDGRLGSHGSAGFDNRTGIQLPAGLPNAFTAQAMLPVLNRREMRGEPGDRDVHGNPNELAAFGDHEARAIWQAVMHRLTAIPGYVDLFASAFPGRPASQLGFEDAARALVAFQIEAFTKTRSPFDRYLDRDDGALTAEQKRGAALFFRDAACVQCHGGPFLGASGFTNTGVPQIGPGTDRQPPLDLGRGEVETHDFAKFAFRIAPLRNVELTAPYMHNGAYATLEAVVRHYDDVAFALRHYDVSQLEPALRAMVHNNDATVSTLLAGLDPRLRTPLDLSEDEQRELIAFLKSLTDPAARDLRTLAPAAVPSGLPVHE
jgi:cytochrome c peroxidase